MDALLIAIGSWPHALPARRAAPEPEVPGARGTPKRRRYRRRVLEVGSGSGYVVTSVQRVLRARGCRAACWATDLNPEAAWATQCTVAAHQVRVLGASLLPSPLVRTRSTRCRPVQGCGGPVLQLC